MKKPHKHAELIKAWADGAEIQYKDSLGNWFDCQDDPRWSEHVAYRIKPEPKPDIVYYGVFDEKHIVIHNVIIDSCFTRLSGSSDHIKVTFDGETGKLKSAEVL